MAITVRPSKTESLPVVAVWTPSLLAGWLAGWWLADTDLCTTDHEPS